MKTNTQLRIIILICFILFQVIQVHAQFLDDPGGDPGYEDVPVDGGLSWLIVAGIGYAAKQISRAKQQC